MPYFLSMYLTSAHYNEDINFGESPLLKDVSEPIFIQPMLRRCYVERCSERLLPIKKPHFLYANNPRLSSWHLYTLKKSTGTVRSFKSQFISAKSHPIYCFFKFNIISIPFKKNLFISKSSF